MRKVKKITKKIASEETVDVICNLCGKSCDNLKRKSKKSNIAEYSGLIEATVTGGYGSDVIGDMTSCRFSICEHCLVKDIFSKMKIKPEWAADFTNFVSEKKFKQKLKEENKKTIKEYVVAIKKLDPTLKQKDLRNMSAIQLNELFHNLYQKSKSKDS